MWYVAPASSRQRCCPCSTPTQGRLDYSMHRVGAFLKAGLVSRGIGEIVRKVDFSDESLVWPWSFINLADINILPQRCLKGRLPQRIAS